MNVGLLILINVVAFFLLFVSAYLIVGYIKHNNVIQDINEKLKENAKNRKNKEELIAIEEGNVEKRNKLFELDLLIEQSGIKKIFPSLTGELFIIFMLVVAVIAFALLDGLVNSVLICISLSVVAAIMLYFVIVLLADKNYRYIEKQIMPFLNIIENYTKTTDDIIDVFGKVYPYLDEPLSSAVQECYVEAMSNGDYRTAFQHFETKIPHEKLSDIIRNIEICSRHEANYDVIVEESRNIMRDYLRSRKEQKVMAQNFTAELVIFTILGFLALNMVNTLISASIWELLFNSFIGNLFVAALIGVYVFSVYSIISVARR